MAQPRPADWLGVPADHHFGLQTLPYCSFSNAHHPARRRVGVAVGDRVLDLTAASERLLPGRAELAAPADRLPRSVGHGRRVWHADQAAVWADQAGRLGGTGFRAMPAAG